MDGQVTTTPKTARTKPAHLMCGSRIWTIVAFASCTYFARVASVRLRSAGLSWSHDTLDIATHLVWVAFMVGLLTETRCWKERVFFVLVLFNFGLAFVMGLWNGASEMVVAKTRVVSAILWSLAALVSFALMLARGEKLETEKAK